MAKLQRKRFVSRLSRSPLAFIVLILLLGLFSYSAVGAYGRSRVAKKRMQKAEAGLATLKDQRGKLQSELDGANTEFGVEKALRENFNVVKEGEGIIVLVDPEEETGVSEEKGEHGGLKEFFKKIFRN